MRACVALELRPAEPWRSGRVAPPAVQRLRYPRLWLPSAARIGRFRPPHAALASRRGGAATRRTGRRSCARRSARPTSSRRRTEPPWPKRPFEDRLRGVAAAKSRARRSPPSTSCMVLFRAFSPVKGRSPPEAARSRAPLTGLEARKTKLGKRSTAHPADGANGAAAGTRECLGMALFTLVSETGILGCRPGDLAMDDGSFASWLGAIRLLTDVQRRTGFMCLALAEADDDVAVVSAEVEQRLPPSVEEISGAIDGEHVGIVSTATGDARPAPASALAAALSRVERAGCPHCASQRLQRWGRASDLPRYRCRDCRRTFNGLTGTPLAHLRKKDRWGAQAEALITGESV